MKSRKMRWVGISTHREEKYLQCYNWKTQEEEEENL
jgi:hypothetical protein